MADAQVQDQAAASAEMINVKLPDGSVKQVPRGTSALEIAKSISPRLADAAMVAKIDGKLTDLAKPIEQDAEVRILTDRDPEALEVYRHSSAHLMRSEEHTSELQSHSFISY